jgi:hypothetical protein
MTERNLWLGNAKGAKHGKASKKVSYLKLLSPLQKNVQTHFLKKRPDGVVAAPLSFLVPR